MTDRSLEQKKQLLGVSASKLDGLSPLGALARGFSVAKGKNGQIIKSVDQICVGDTISVMVEDGKISATATKTEKKNMS